jgi:hypothetical protein
MAVGEFVGTGADVGWLFDCFGLTNVGSGNVGGVNAGSTLGLLSFKGDGDNVGISEVVGGAMGGGVNVTSVSGWANGLVVAGGLLVSG